MQRIERRHSKPDDNEIKWLDIYLMTCGNSSVGRARPCQGRGREFESRFPLQINSIGSCGCFSIKGALAKRLCSGLQIRLVRFDSGTRLHFISRARMVESVDTRDLKSLGVRAVWVQVPLRLPWEKKNKINDKQCRVNHRKVVFYCLFFAILHCFAIQFRHKKRALLPSDHRHYSNFPVIPILIA